MKHFQLMLDAWAPSSLSDQVNVVLENAAKVGVSVGDAELVSRPAFE